MDGKLAASQNTLQTYYPIHHSLISAQDKVNGGMNSAVLIAYWKIVEQIYKVCDGNVRAEDGKSPLEYIAVLSY